MKKFFAVAVLGLVLGIANITMAKTFVDVPSGHWAEDAIQKLSDAGVLEGYPTGDYKGDRNLTRYEYAMAVSRMLDWLDKHYCTEAECKEDLPENIATKADLDEIKDIVTKLAAEFKDELAALKVKVDENRVMIEDLQEDVAKSRIGNIYISGAVRQRIDAPNTDMSIAAFSSSYWNYMYNNTGTVTTRSDLKAGYEMVPSLTFSGKSGENIDFSIGLDTSITSSPMGYDGPYEQGEGDLIINHAYADIDFSANVRELDLLKVKSGYQSWDFGPYGMLANNAGVTSNAAVRLDVAKRAVSLTTVMAMADMGASVQGVTTTGNYDPYGALRLDIDTRWLDLGANFLADGLGQEKGWGLDVVAPLLTHSPFLKEFRAEYMQVTDLADGTSPGTTADDSSFMIGLDVYETSKVGVTLSYADLPAAVAFTSMDANPFTEYDSLCPRGLDVAPNSVWANQCYNLEGSLLFPAGFEGLGVEASYIVFGDVTLAAKGFLGNFAGGVDSSNVNIDGADYPGFGAFSISKPINESSTIRIEYAQQGADPILLNRVRGELVISF